MALFSTLLSSSNGDASSSAALPTLLQLFTTKAIVLDSSVKLANNAVLSYQAIEVSSNEEGEETLFGHKRKKAANVVEKPNLGVWNCCCKPHGSSSALSDQLLRVPDASSIDYCFTVDLTDPTKVEPTLAVLQAALIRLLIQGNTGSTPVEPVSKNRTTSLYDLRLQQFGLAPEGTPTSTSAAPDGSDRNVKIGLMICAIRRQQQQQDDYKETQAQNLVYYHLRRFAAAVNATLCMVRLTGEELEDQPTLTLTQVAHTWREFCLGNDVGGKVEQEGHAAVYGPGSDVDLIESVLLKNAQCPGHWNATKDSLWVALPETSELTKGAEDTAPKSDEAWLSQLQQSVGVVATSAEPAAPSPAPKKADDAAVASFFEDLLKK